MSPPSINFLNLTVSEIEPGQHFIGQGHYGKVKGEITMLHIYTPTNVPTKYQLPVSMVTIKTPPQHKQFCISMGVQTSHLSVIHCTNKFAFQWGRILTLTPFFHPQHKQVCIPMGEGSNPHTSLSAKVQISFNFNSVWVKVNSMKSKIFESTHIFLVRSSGRDIELFSYHFFYLVTIRY